MSKVFTALAVSVDGYITGRDPGPGRGLGDGGVLFDWYVNGDTASQVFDVAVMGGGAATAAPRAGLLDEVVLHQVPVLLGAGRRFFGELPAHIGLILVEAVPAPGITHLRYRVSK